MTDPLDEKLPEGLPARLRLAGWLIAAGMLVSMPTLVWNHAVSFFVFLCCGGLLTVAGVGIYLYSIARDE